MPEMYKVPVVAEDAAVAKRQPSPLDGACPGLLPHQLGQCLGTSFQLHSIRVLLQTACTLC
jgi:hypothetical protein